MAETDFEISAGKENQDDRPEDDLPLEVENDVESNAYEKVLGPGFTPRKVV
jgi:hypothetical protein